MKKDSNIYFVLDRSGSMQTMHKEAMEGFNMFVEEQKTQEGGANLTLVIFDNVCDTVYSKVPINEVPKLTSRVYTPRGMTALYDAIGCTVLEAIANSKDDNKNILVVLTDGYENSSKEFSRESLKALTTRIQDKLDWTVLFLGANMDAHEVAESFGLLGKNVTTFETSAKGMQASMASASFATRSTRGAASGVSMPDIDPVTGLSFTAYAKGETTFSDVYTNLAK